MFRVSFRQAVFAAFLQFRKLLSRNARLRIVVAVNGHPWDAPGFGGGHRFPKRSGGIRAVVAVDRISRKNDQIGLFRIEHFVHQGA